MKNEESDKNVIMNDTKTESENVTWIIIGGEKKWIRRCPKCNKEIYYTQSYNKNFADKINSLCLECTKNKRKISSPCYSINIDGVILWIRICPQCKKLIHHKREQNCKVYDRQKRLCLICASTGVNNPFYGKRHLKETKKKLSAKIKIQYKNGRLNPRSGVKLTNETKRKIAITRIGEKNPFYKIGFMKGKHHTEKTKEKLREITLKKIKYRFGKTFHNPKACEYFDKLNEEKGWDLQHAQNGGEINCIGYSLDAYDKKKNIVIEYDEPFHYHRDGILKPKDIKRMNKIINHLGCKFYRYNEKTSELKSYN